MAENTVTFEQTPRSGNKPNSSFAFSIGSPVCFKISSHGDPCVVHVGEGCILKLNTVTSIGNDSIMRPFLFSSESDGIEPHEVCFLKPQQTVTNVGLMIAGPRNVRLHAGNEDDHFGEICINVLGFVEKSACSRTETSLPTQKMNGTSAKKRKALTHLDESKPKLMPETKVKDSENADSSNQRKSRKKLSKQKQKELEEVLAEGRTQAESRDEILDATDEDASKEFNNKPAISERRLDGGVVVKDIIIGGGPLVKPGRKVSILYEGKLEDGTVFDKKQNKRSPFQFRQGTGQVIKGLERGLEGMRSGGERIIKVPPKLGYGSKGAGPVPKNATLTFSIYLLSVGGSTRYT